LSVTLSEDEGRCVIRFEGDVDITSSTELKQVLLQTILPGTELQLDLSLAGGFDITAIQLLWAAARETEKLGTPFTVAGQLPEKLSCAIRDAGLEQFLGANHVEGQETAL
jgi:anti-anti-sigma regulatory factor